MAIRQLHVHLGTMSIIPYECCGLLSDNLYTINGYVENSVPTIGEIGWRPAGRQGLARGGDRDRRSALGARALTLQVKLDCLGVLGSLGFRLYSFILDAETEHEPKPNMEGIR